MLPCGTVAAPLRERAYANAIGRTVMTHVYIANFGPSNLLWPDCYENAVIATFDDEDTWPYVDAGDKEGYVAHCVANKLTRRGKPPTKSLASRWFNLGEIILASDDDIWIHREKDELWWTRTLREAGSTQLEESPWAAQGPPRIYVHRKPTGPWTKVDAKGRPLAWNGLHSKAREFLFTEGTLQALNPDNASYALALIRGDDLSPWHKRHVWREREDKAGKSAVKHFTPREQAVARMARTAEETVRGSQGPAQLTTPKRKELRMSPAELRTYIESLLADQEGLCALTGIPLEYDGSFEDPELLCSLDRIDSDGHYEAGNLQVVCRFVNRWKSADKDDEFRRLLALVRACGTS